MRKNILMSLATAALITTSIPSAAFGYNGLCYYPGAAYICDQFYGEGCAWCTDTSRSGYTGDMCTFVGRQSYFGCDCFSQFVS